jgi:hypothetical protein
MNNFDTQPLLTELNTIINNGFQEILKDYMKRHWLLEQTHDTLVNLPTVKEHYANKSESATVPASECYKDVKVKLEPGLEYVTKEETLKLIKNIDDKMSDFIKSNNELFNKLLIQMNELKNEIDGLKNEKKNSLSFSHNEKENITLEIVDENVSEGLEKDIEDEVTEVHVETKIEELDVEEEEEEEVEEEEEEEVEEEEVEEEEEEEEEEVEETEDVVSVETETKEDEEDEEDEEEELIEIEIDDVTYCTNNEENGIIYELDKEGNVGKRVGCLKEGDAYFD